MLDLRQVFSSVQAATAQRHSDKIAESGVSGVATAPLDSHILPPPIVCIVLATDGVWDNWAYEDVTRFVMDHSCLNAVSSGRDGAERVAKAFMQRNALYAKRNFGAQADNATGIVVYLSESPSLPHV